MNFKLSSLYVGDLHPEVTEYMLAEKFSPAGQIHSLRVCRNWNTSASFGYAYVNFLQQADAERALETLNCELLLGQPMRVMWSQRDSTIRKSGVGNLFVKNLDLLTIDSMALFDLFSVFGKVLSCKVVAYKTGTKGYGYIQFESQEAANLAKERLDGKLFNNHKVSIEHFKTREDREAEVNHHAPGFNNKLKILSKKERQDKPAHRNMQRVEKVQKTAPSFTPIQKFKPIKSYAQAVETVPAVDTTVEESPAAEESSAPDQVPAVEESSAPDQVPAAEESSAPAQVPAVEESPAPDQVSAVEESPAPAQVPAVEQSPAPLQVPAMEEKPAPSQVPAVEEKPAPSQVPAVEEKPAPSQVPAVEEKPAPSQVPAVEEKPAPSQIPAVEEKPAPPQVPAVEEKPAPPQVPAVEEKPAPSQVPAVEEKPAPVQVPAVEEKPAPVPAVEESLTPPQGRNSVKTPSASVDKMDILLKAVEAVKLETLTTVSGMKKQRNNKRKKIYN